MIILINIVAINIGFDISVKLFSFFLGLGSSLISKSFLTDDIPYQELGSNYHREFLGVSFDEEKDPVIQKLISKIKKETEIH